MSEQGIAYRQGPFLKPTSAGSRGISHCVCLRHMLAFDALTPSAALTAKVPLCLRLLLLD